jgi:7-alpha-hydroxysteroid dehydrogenase
MILDRFSVAGKVAIVTGAGLGIGRGIALGLAEAGADVVLAARTESDLEEVAGEVRSLGRRALVVSTDVTDAAACEQLVKRTVEEFGQLDILVNNAGGAMPRAAMDTSEGFMARTFAFNVTAPLTLTKLAARQMVDTVGGGAIVNISSRSASMTQTMFVAYGAAKAALDRMTRNIAPELAPRVRVNAIDVGGVATRSLDIVLTDDALRQQFLDGTPMGRPGEPEDIACAVLYLVSDASSWVTGKVFESRRRHRGAGHDGAGTHPRSGSGEPRRLLRPQMTSHGNHDERTDGPPHRGRHGSNEGGLQSSSPRMLRRIVPQYTGMVGRFGTNELPLGTHARGIRRA